MLLDDFKRLIRPIKNRIFLMLGRAVLKLVDNSEATQRIQVIALADETISNIERFQEYGIETYPKTESQVFIGFLNGNRDHGIVLCVHDDRYRPTDLSEGEVALYTYEDATTPFRWQMKLNRIAYLRADKMQVVADTEAYINSPSVVLGTDSAAAAYALIDSRFQALYNAHTHGGGAAVDVAMGAAHMTSKTKGV